MFKNILILIRPFQWLKNGVVLAPLVFAGEMANSGSIKLSLIAAGCFCLLSSGLYTINDIFDRNYDRQHPLKKYRPIASGVVSVPIALVIAFALLGSGIILTRFINPQFLLIVSIFVALNLIYSIFLKNIVLLDVLSIAFSFVIRAYAGAVAINVEASKWMLINTFLLALFLGFGKRRHELVLLEENAIDHRKILHRYSPYLLDQLIGVTTASVVVMYMLYSFSSEVSEKLETESLYLTIPFVVYGIFRYLYLIHKEEKGGSPTNILIGDRPILITVILWIAASISILYYN